jgi:uncharacterized protein YecE (DUF72 family)
LTEYLIGAGGWAYFKIPRLQSLSAYSRVFNFVEVNSTFYQIPSIAEAEKWRKMVPQDFQFSVRAHESITHREKLRPVAVVFAAFEKMKRICSELNAHILHLQTPASFKLDHSSIENMGQTFSSLNLGNLRIALEIRGRPDRSLPADLIRVMEDSNIVHSVDISKDESPAYQSDILYTRLFGKGEHNVYQPTDEELKSIDRKAIAAGSRKIAMSFHFVKMYKDAVRLKTYKKTGKFPSVTSSTGVDSLQEVLEEDATFPSTRQQLIRSQGWKLFDLTKINRIRVVECLQNLPEATYNNAVEVVEALKSMELGS